MHQPITTSEGVRRCFEYRPLPPSSLYHKYEFGPQPPYAAGKNAARPYSAPAYRTERNYTVPSPPKRSNLYNRPIESDVSRRAPYAPRKFNSVVNTTSGFNKIENYGKSPALPSYDPLNDVHLVDYFEKRFGSLQLDALRRRNMIRRLTRPGSSLSTNSSILTSKRKRQKSASDILYKVSVTTGTKPNAGTDAKIFIKMKGTKDKINKIRLSKKAGSVKSSKSVSFRFAKGSTHVFKIKGPEIGNLKSIIVENAGHKKEDAWFLQQIEVVNTKTKKSWLFVANQWLSLYHSDGQTTRELFAQTTGKTEYEIVTVTGDRVNAGTNANVFLTLFGKSGITKRFHLKNYEKGLFDRGTTDVFRFASNCVGPMKKIRIEHDNTGIGAGWYLERVVVTDLKNPEWKYFFPCGQWLAIDEGDGCISRDLVGSKDPMAIRKATKYKVTVFTGDKKGAGTDANVSIILFGEFGDSGEKKLSSRKNNFERNSIDEFFLECPKLGRLERIRIGHDDSGFGPGWFLDKVIVDDVAVSRVYEFPCQRWLASDEDDGQISRELVINVGPNDASLGFKYVITVATGDKVNAGTDARVWLILHGGKNKQDSSGKIWLDSGKFQRNKSDLFNIGIATMLSPLSKIDIGHDNKGAASGWFLDSVTIYCLHTGLEQYFPCHKWLAIDEGDRVISRTLTEGGRVVKTKKTAWTCWVCTSDKGNAGTNSNVFICVYGDKGKSDDIPLEGKGDAFEAGSRDIFNISMVDIGKPYKLRVWHDNKGIAPGWHLEKIELECQGIKDRYIFYCDRWLANDEGDQQTVRELPAEGTSIKKPLPLEKYKIEVYTGNRKYAGTDANVYLCIFGERGDTGNRFLRHSDNNINKFEKGEMDTCEIEAVSLLKLKKIRIGHDGLGPGSGWFLDKVVIKQVGQPKYDTTFVCNRWLAEDEDDGLIEREITASGSQMLSTTSYHVKVKTGDVKGAGTDANVYLKIFGTNGDTGKIQLRQSDSASNKFERNRTDLFTLEATDIGKIQRIKIGHDGSKPGAGWFLDNVIIDIPSKGKHYQFACHRWLAKDEDDGLIELELTPSVSEDRDKTIPYEVTVWTSDKSGGGTDANVFIQMYGENGKTEQVSLRNKSDEFERGCCDKFKIEAADVGRLQKLRVGHDGAGRMSGWHCETILIQRRPIQGTKKRRRLTKQKSSSRFRDDNDSDSSPSSSPRRRQMKRRNTKSNLESVREEEEEDVYDGEETEDYWFYVNRWFAKGEDDGNIVRELIPTDKNGRPLDNGLDEVEYTVKVYTGDIFGAGTDANVFVNLFGEKGDSGERHMKDSNHINKFEKNTEDIFSVNAIDLGKLMKVKVRHDNKGGGAAWFLDRIEVVDNKRNKSYFFPCQRWLAVDEDDGQIARELVPVDPSLKKKLTKKDSKSIFNEIALEQKAAMTTYHVCVETGNKFGAGTDANVYIILFGEQDTTGKMFLKSSMTNKNKFERGQKDEFILEAVQIGELKKIKIGHDNAGGGGAWYLENVIIDAPSLGRKWIFPCSRWLSEKDDDGQLERELYPQELATQEYNPCIPYEITTYTSDKSGASTDADVYVVLYGRDSCTEEKSLCSIKRERKDKFNRGSVDKFIVELEDVGEQIEKLRIGHDGTGFGAGWHLEKVEIRRLHETGKTQGSITYVFPCNRWLARNEDDRAIERELLPEKAIKEVVDKRGEVKAKDLKLHSKLKAKKYTVNVITGDKSGCGTDANVFLNIFGDRGDTGERKLHQSETHRDKFERKQTDVFKIEAADLGKVYKIKIRHDNSMINPSWFLDRVEVIDTDDDQTYIFHCERWLAKNKDDGKIDRTLYVKGYDGDMSSTGTLKSTRIGSVSSLDSIRTNDPFSKSPRLSRKQLSSSLENVPEGPTISYTVKVSTGIEDDHGTDSNVWINLYGPKKKSTGRLFLELAQKNSFEPGSLEVFSLEAIDVDEIKKVELGHDGTAPGTGWYVKELEVDMPTKGKHYHFTCNQWLARDRGDGKTSRILNVTDGQTSVLSYKPMIPYELTVHTGDVSDAGTDSKITLTVFGSKGTTSPIELDKGDDRFERAKADFIKLELEDVGDIKKIRVNIDGRGSRPTWFLEKIELRNMESYNLSVFHCKDWFSKDTSLSRDIPATEKGKKVISKTNYKVKVKTSDLRGSGTDANVYIIMFGSNGDSGEIHLKKPENNKSPFNSNQLDEFAVDDVLSVGELSKVRVWHDNRGLGASWHLSYIEIEDLSSKKVYMFHCDKWLSTSEDDKQIIRELTCSNSAKPGGSRSKDKITYDIEILTTDKKDGGTSHNAWMVLEGSKHTSSILLIENGPRNKILRRGQTDHIRKDCLPLGKLKSCIIGGVEREDSPIIDDSGRAAQWHCHEINITDTSTGDIYKFACRQWIPISSKISKRDAIVLNVKGVEEGQVAVVRNLAPIKYEVVVYTGDEKGCGTNANVNITLFGSHGDTGSRPLKQRFRDLFERNQVDKFQIEALDLGELTKIRIEHDNSGFRPGWFLDKVEVINMATNITTLFPCNKWFDKDKGDGEISRDLYPLKD